MPSTHSPFPPFSSTHKHFLPSVFLKKKHRLPLTLSSTSLSFSPSTRRHFAPPILLHKTLHSTYTLFHLSRFLLVHSQALSSTFLLQKALPSTLRLSLPPLSPSPGPPSPLSSPLFSHTHAQTIQVLLDVSPCTCNTKYIQRSATMDGF